LSGGKNSYVATLVERLSRFLMLIKSAEQRHGGSRSSIEQTCSQTSSNAATLADLGSRTRNGQAQGIYGSDGCAESDTEVVCAALETGALGYVHKSSVGNDLGLAIAAALNGKQFVSDRLKVPVFDIFAGLADKDAVYLETVAGLSSARERMEAIAAKEPGRYFVFSPRDHTILAKTETREKPERVSKLKNDVA